MSNTVTIPTDHAARREWFGKLAHVVHLGRCTRFPFGDCRLHEEAGYFTPKDNDIASTVLRWLEYESIDLNLTTSPDRESHE